MTKKQLLLNPYGWLHLIYGAESCLLCNAHEKIRELEKQIAGLKEQSPKDDSL